MLPGEEGRSQGRPFLWLRAAAAPAQSWRSRRGPFVLLPLEGAVSSLRALHRAGTPLRVKLAMGDPCVG